MPHTNQAKNGTTNLAAGETVRGVPEGAGIPRAEDVPRPDELARRVPKRSQAEVSETMKAVFVQGDEASAKAKASEVPGQFQKRFSKAMEG